MAFQTIVNVGFCRLIKSAFLDFVIPLKIMENNTVSNQLEVLLGRLKEAERRAKLLNLEVKRIRQAIGALQQTVTSTDINNQDVILIQPTVPTLSFRQTIANIDNLANNTVVDSPAASNKREAEDSSSSSKKLKVSLPMDNGYVKVYTDGACENNGKSNPKAGIGVWFDDGHPLNISKPVQGRATNNHAEIRACIEALNTIKENGGDKVAIHTDSEFTINCMTKWIHGWKRNNWKTAKGGPVKNKEELEELDRVMDSFEDVKWVHVDGHRGIWGNEAADKLAREGARRYNSN